MHRSVSERISALSNSLPLRAAARASRRAIAAAVSGGIRPFLGAVMIEVRRFGEVLPSFWLNANVPMS
jgi:hypothetical protein